MNDFERLCTKSGLKLTGQRRAVLRVLHESKDHPTVEDISKRAKRYDMTISLATVYRTLNMLEKLDLIRRHEFLRGASQYEINQHDNHQHLIDIKNNKIIEFKSQKAEKLIKELATELGYKINHFNIKLYGKKT